jgi:hypothetical protein
MRASRLLWVIAVFSNLLAFTQPMFAQGALSPTAAPAPTMKTLQQVEPRTPITNATAVTINTSGSYYLTTNITVASGQGIIINPSGVTLDLNGFTISSTSASPSGNGILLATGISDITILNGHITGSVTYSGGTYSGGGFVNGINYTISQPFNVRVSGVSVSGCGTYGIYLGTNNSTVADSCTVKTVGGYGFVASTVTRSTAYQCGNVAITANIASDCYGYSTGGNGFTVSETANNCYGYTTAGSDDGLDANNANNCYGNSTGSGYGLNAYQTATGCSGVSSNGTGLFAYNANNCYGLSSGAGYGLYAALTATGCSGQSDSGGYGLYANNANNCYGSMGTGSGVGLDATTANNCYGFSDSGDGLDADRTATGCVGGSGFGNGLNASSIAIGCYGYSLFGGTGLVANVANSCAGSGTTPYIVPNKYNMP